MYDKPTMLPTSGTNDPLVEVLDETETHLAWSFRVRVTEPEDPEPSEHRVTLAWVDYEHIAHGIAAPERVAKAAAEVLLASGEDLPIRFDVSTARRLVHDFDDLARARL